MVIKLTGWIERISDTVDITNTFRKREFVLRVEEEWGGEIHDNYVPFVTTQLKIHILDTYKEGDRVCVSFTIKGRKWVSKKDGVTIGYSSENKAFAIDPVRQPYEPTAPGIPSTGMQPSQPDMNLNAGGNTGANNYNPSPENVDDLPF